MLRAPRGVPVFATQSSEDIQSSIEGGKGEHTFDLVFQTWRERIAASYSGNNGRAGPFIFYCRYTAVGDLAGSDAARGIAEAAFLLPPAEPYRAGVRRHLGPAHEYVSTYFQDGWHVCSNLNLNGGLREELHTHGWKRRAGQL